MGSKTGLEWEKVSRRIADRKANAAYNRSQIRLSRMRSKKRSSKEEAAIRIAAIKDILKGDK